MATKKKNSELFSSLLYIIIGVLIAIRPDLIVEWGAIVVGALFVVSGVLDLIKRNFLGGAVSLIIGAVILTLGGAQLFHVVLLVLGIMIAVKGVLALIDALRGHGNALTVVFAALTIAIGVFLAFGDAGSWIIIVSGVLLAIDGVIGLIGALKK